MAKNKTRKLDVVFNLIIAIIYNMAIFYRR